MRAAMSSVRPMGSTRTLRRGYRGRQRPLRWAPLPLLLAGLALARTVGAQPVTTGPSAAVPRAARVLARGETLAATDIAAAPGDTLAAQLVGWTTRRLIGTGEPLRPPAITPPATVRAGDHVAVVWQQGGVALRLAGTAATDAPLGTRVAVRVDMHRRFEGTVTAPGVVTLP